MEKIIGVDLDEVLSETIDGVLRFHDYQIKGIPAHKEDISDYYLWDMEKYGVTQEEGVRYFRSFLDEAQAREDIMPVKGAKEGLERFKNDGRKIVIVTARREEIREFTMRRLDKNFYGLRDEVLFANHFSEKERSKSEVCKKNGIKTMIEDNLDYAIELANMNIKVYLLDKPWNQRYNPEIHKNIYKFYNWDELRI